jgi:4-aminobutyrate--pyruvate transaminase
LEALILREGPETVAAFFAEPIAGSSGVTIPPAGYYQKIQSLLARHEVLFCVDEVITGFCRTGNMFGCETTGIKPDAMTLAKGLTSAYQPLAAIVISDKIFRGLQKGTEETSGFFAHGATYSGHPVACAVGLRVLELLEERDILGHVRHVSKRFAERIQGFADHPLVGEVRSVGLMGAIELIADKATRRFFDPVGSVSSRVLERAEQQYGLIFRNVILGDICAFSPPLIITEAEIDEVFDRFGQALDDVAATVTG